MRKFIKLHRKSKKISWGSAPDVKKRVKHLASSLNLVWIKPTRIFCVRSKNANTRAYARIWGLAKIWQDVLRIKPAYIIEVISEKYDGLPLVEQDKILLHEITHIPKNFSGALAPHIRSGKRSFHSKLELLVAQYLNRSEI